MNPRIDTSRSTRSDSSVGVQHFGRANKTEEDIVGFV